MSAQLKERLLNESDICRDVGAHGIAALLDDAARFIDHANTVAGVVSYRLSEHKGIDFSFERDFLGSIKNWKRKGFV